MAIYTIEADGKQFDIEGPDGATAAELQDAVTTHLSSPSPAAPQPGMLEQAGQLYKTAAEFEQKANPIGVLKQVDSGLDTLGDKTETYLAGKGHATAGKVVGGAISHIPEIAGAIEGGVGIAKAAPAMARGATSMLRSATDKLLGPGLKAAEMEGEAMLAPLERQLASHQEQLANLPTKLSDKLKMLREMRREAGNAIGMAEDRAGFPFKTVPEGFSEIIRNPKKAEEFGTLMGQIADKSPKQLLDEMDVKTLQLVRKLGQEFNKIGAKVPSILEANIAKGREAAAKALELSDKGFAAARKNYLEVDSLLKSLPEETRNQKIHVNLAIKKTKQALLDLKDEIRVLKREGASRDTTRKVAVGAAAGLAGLPFLKNFIK